MDIFRNKHFCITGRFARYLCDELITIVEGYGATYDQTVRKSTDVLLVGKNKALSRKNKKAIEQQIQIINEDYLYQLLDGERQMTIDDYN